MEALSRQAYATPQQEQGSPRQATSPTGTHNILVFCGIKPDEITPKTQNSQLSLKKKHALLPSTLY
jgi:hypothetical protein